MRRGQCLSPLTAPAQRDSAVLPLKVILPLGGAQSGGDETPMSVHF